MKEGHVLFQECVLFSQKYGSTDEHMHAEVKFKLTVDGKEDNLTVHIKQPTGGNFEETPIEMSYPKGYKGLIHYQSLQDAVEQYYRTLIGKQGKAIRTNENTSNMTLSELTIQMPKYFQIEIPDQGFGW